MSNQTPESEANSNSRTWQFLTMIFAIVAIIFAGIYYNNPVVPGGSELANIPAFASDILVTDTISRIDSTKRIILLELIRKSCNAAKQAKAMTPDIKLLTLDEYWACDDMAEGVDRVPISGSEGCCQCTPASLRYSPDSKFNNPVFLDGQAQTMFYIKNNFIGNPEITIFDADGKELEVAENIDLFSIPDNNGSTEIGALSIPTPQYEETIYATMRFKGLVDRKAMDVTISGVFDHNGWMGIRHVESFTYDGVKFK